MRRLAAALLVSFSLGAGEISAQRPPTPLGGRTYPDKGRGATQVYERWYSTTRSDTALVFVHGILSNNRDAWWYHDPISPADSSRDAYWPELIAQDPRFGSPSIFLAGYYTAPRSGPYDVAQAARAMATALLIPDANGLKVLDKRNIVFIAHSTGGLVVRYLLTHYQHLFRGKNVGVVLMASPASGSEWAQRFWIVIKLAGNEMADELKPESPFLKALFTDFQDLLAGTFVREFSLTGTSGCENHFIVRRSWMPDLTRVVDSQSCGSFFNAPTIIRDTDHYTVVKPSGMNSQSHTFLLGFLQQQYAPMVKGGTTVADTIRITVRPKPQVWVQVDSTFSFTNVLPPSVCSSDAEFSARVAPPPGWRLPGLARVSAEVSDTSAIRLNRILSDGDSVVVAAIGRTGSPATSTGACSTPVTVTLRVPLSTARMGPAVSSDSVVVILTTTAPQAVLDRMPLKLSLGEFVEWKYEIHATGTVDGMPFSGALQNNMTVGKWRIGSYQLLDGRMLLIAIPTS